MSAGAYAYFGYVIFFVLFLYVITLSIFLCIRRTNIKNAIEFRNTVRGTNDEEQDFYDRANYSFEFRTDFDAMTVSALGKGCKFFLMCSRVVGLIFFITASIMINIVRDNHGLFYFTNWNSLLVTVFYAAATASSLLSVYAKSQRNRLFNTNVQIKWSYSVRCLGLLTHMLFEITGASSMFVMIFDFYFQREHNNDMVSLLNFVRALTVCALVFEMSINHINVRFDQYPACIAWTMVYLLFVWPAVFVGIMQKWPYFLLKTDTPLCFGYYLLIFILNFGCYLLWWFFYKVKKTIYIHYSIGRVGNNYWDDAEFDESDMFLEDTMNPLSMHGLLNNNGHGGIEMGQLVYDDDGYSVATSAYAIDGYGEGDYEGVEGAAYIDETAFHDPSQLYYPYDPNMQYYDPNMQYYDPNDPNMQYQYDPNMQYYDPNNPNMQYVQYEPNVQYDPNMQYDPNIQHQYDPNIQYQYDPNVQYYDPNDPNTKFDPRMDPRYQQWHQQQQQHLQYPEGWHPQVDHATHDPSRSQNFSSTYGQFGDDTHNQSMFSMEAGDFNPSPHPDDHQGQRALPARPYQGSVLERGRGGRGAGRGGRGHAGRSGGADDRYRDNNETEQSSTPAVPGPIVVDAQPYLGSADEADGAPGVSGEESATFDYNLMDAWASFTGAGKVPHSAAEAKSGGGILSYFGFGAAGSAAGSTTAPKDKPKSPTKRGPPPANSSQYGAWMQDVAEGEHGAEEEYDEEHNFGTDQAAAGMDGSVHKTGAFIAQMSKGNAFKAPAIATHRRPGGGHSPLASSPVNAAGTPRNRSGSNASVAAGLIRPPSLHKMFRTGSRGANKEAQSLNLQALGSRQGETESTPGLLRPPSMGKMFSPRSFGSFSKQKPQGRSALNLQTLESRNGSTGGMKRTASMDNSQHEGFDYSEMDAWQSFNAAGRVPHTPNEVERSTADKPSGFQNLEPMLKSHAGEKAGAVPKGGWFGTTESEQEGFEDMRAEAEQFHPEDQPHDSHLAGAYVAQAAKREAFHTPASLDSHRPRSIKAPPQSAKSPTAISPNNTNRPMFRPPSMPRMFRSKSKEGLHLQELGTNPARAGAPLPRPASGLKLLPRPPSARNVLPSGGSEGFDYSQMDAWQSFNAAGRVPHNPNEIEHTSSEQPSGFQNLEPMLRSHAGKKAGSVLSPTAAARLENLGEGEEDGFNYDGMDGSDQVHDSHLAGAYVAHVSKNEAFRAPSILDKNTHRKAPPAAAAVSPRPVPVNANPMFRPPSLHNMFANKSKDSLKLQALGSSNKLPRPPSARNIKNPVAPEGFDYSEMDAWQSFNAAGRVPQSPQEIDHSASAQPSGFQNLEPMLKSHAGEKAGAAVVAKLHAEDGEDGNTIDYGMMDGSDQVRDSHLAGAYVAHVSKNEAFRAPSILDKNTYRKAPPAAAAVPVAPARGPGVMANPMFRPPSMSHMFNRGAPVSDAPRRSLNLTSLGSRGDMRPPVASDSAPLSGAASGKKSGEKSGEKSGSLFRPPSVSKMPVNRTMAPLTALGAVTPKSGVKAGSNVSDPAGEQSRSFFEKPEEDA